MNVKKSDINILIMLIGVLLAVLSYFIVYNSFSEKKDTLAAENVALQSEVDELQKLADNKKFYIDETNRMDNEIRDIISGFPGEIRSEDEVMYAAGLELVHAIWAKGLTIEDTEMVQVAVPVQQQPTEDAIVEDTGDGTGDGTGADAVVATGGLKDTVFLYSSPFTLNYKVTYRSFKDIVQLIVTSDERMSIKNISLTYDSQYGCLDGTLDAVAYTVSGTDYLYKELDIPGVRLGTADLFKSGTILDLSRPESDNESEDSENADGAQGSEDVGEAQGSEGANGEAAN